MLSNPRVCISLRLEAGGEAFKKPGNGVLAARGRLPPRGPLQALPGSLAASPPRTPAPLPTPTYAPFAVGTLLRPLGWLR